jgi:hypothetical protein
MITLAELSSKKEVASLSKQQSKQNLPNTPPFGIWNQTDAYCDHFFGQNKFDHTKQMITFTEEWITTWKKTKISQIFNHNHPMITLTKLEIIIQLLLIGRCKRYSQLS